MKKKICVFLLLAMLSASSVSCGKNEPAPEVSSSQQSSSEQQEPEEPSSSEEQSSVSTSPTEISDDIYSFQFSLDGVVYTLPEEYSKFTENGWSSSDVDGKTLDPNTKTLGNVLKKGEMTVMIYMFNPSKDVLSLEDCVVSGVEVQKYYEDKTSSNPLFPNNIKFGSSKDEVVAAYGEPSDLRENDTFSTMEYTVDVYTNARIQIDNTTNEVIQLRMDCYEKRADNTAATQAALDGKENYDSPTDLGDNWDSFNVKYDGVVYNLPAPVSAFLQNGWELETDATKTIAAKKTEISVLFRKGNVTFKAQVKNYGDTEAAITEGYVQKLIYSETQDFLAPTELAKGITQDSKKDDVIASYGEPDKVEDSTTMEFLNYGSFGEKVTIGIMKDTQKVFLIEVENSPKTLPE